MQNTLWKFQILVKQFKAGLFVSTLKLKNFNVSTRSRCGKRLRKRLFGRLVALAVGVEACCSIDCRDIFDHAAGKVTPIRCLHNALRYGLNRLKPPSTTSARPASEAVMDRAELSPPPEHLHPNRTGRKSFYPLSRKQSTHPPSDIWRIKVPSTSDQFLSSRANINPISRKIDAEL